MRWVSYRVAFLDWLACAEGGRAQPAAWAAQAAGDPVAALGAARHVLDFDDTFLPGIAHLSAPVAPGALYVAAEVGAPIEDMLAAYAAGFEAMGALARASHPALYDRGFHPTAVCGSVGAAVAAARLLEADERTAVALAVLRAAGLRAAFGSDGKSLQVGLAASAGVTAARLAAPGATPPRTRVPAGWPAPPRRGGVARRLRRRVGGARPRATRDRRELDQGVAVLSADARRDRVRDGARRAPGRAADRDRPPRLAPGRRLRRRRDAAAGEVLDPVHDGVHA